jgi:multidrug efflux system membrane fusion protein
VESRPVVVGSSLKDETIVDQGLKPGEIVVTNGQLRLVPGTLVKVKQGPASDPGKGL